MKLSINNLKINKFGKEKVINCQNLMLKSKGEHVKRPYVVTFWCWQRIQSLSGSITANPS